MTTTPLSPSQAGRPIPQQPAPVPSASELSSATATIRTLLKAGRTEEARRQLERLTTIMPQAEEPWLQLLTLNPAPQEEIALIEGFLQHHPTHRFAAAMRARLEHTRIVLLLGAPARTSTPAPVTPATTLRLGDYLVQRGWVTLEQVELALAEQRRLRELGLQQRLGAILLMNGQLQADQLAVALAEVSGGGFGEFGDYLVRDGLLTPMQVGQALARQAALAAAGDREYLAALASQKSGLGRLLGKGREPRRAVVPRLGEVMVSMGLLTQEQVEQVLRERQRVFEASFE